MNEGQECTIIITTEETEKVCVEKNEDNMTPLEKWIQKNPQTREPEVQYLLKAGLGSTIQIAENGNLQLAFMVENWAFLMVIDKMFPKMTEDENIPVKVCLAAPNLEELRAKISDSSICCVAQDHAGVSYLTFDEFKEEYIQYINGQHDRLLTETILQHTRKWVGLMLYNIKTEKNEKTNKGIMISILPFVNFRHFGVCIKEHLESRENRSKYTEGRRSLTQNINPRCEKVVLSNRAYIQIYNESQSHIQTETGGLLLGHYEKSVWYVVEASDPGINAKFYNAYHEGDDVYENHVCGVISRTYKHPLVFLGMWHRHPGSFDCFSGTDDITNYKYAGSAGNGCISAIINYDPEFRITFYYVEQGERRQVYYTRVDIEVGDDNIPNKEMLKIASREDVMRRLNG